MGRAEPPAVRVGASKDQQEEYSRRPQVGSAVPPVPIVAGWSDVPTLSSLVLWALPSAVSSHQSTWLAYAGEPAPRNPTTVEEPGWTAPLSWFGNCCSKYWLLASRERTQHCPRLLARTQPRRLCCCRGSWRKEGAQGRTALQGTEQCAATTPLVRGAWAVSARGFCTSVSPLTLNNRHAVGTPHLSTVLHST